MVSTQVFLLLDTSSQRIVVKHLRVQSSVNVTHSNVVRQKLEQYRCMFGSNSVHR